MAMLAMNCAMAGLRMAPEVPVEDRFLLLAGEVLERSREGLHLVEHHLDGRRVLRNGERVDVWFEAPAHPGNTPSAVFEFEATNVIAVHCEAGAFLLSRLRKRRNSASSARGPVRSVGRAAPNASDIYASSKAGWM